MKAKYPTSDERRKGAGGGATLTVREARASFSEVIHQAEHGAEFTITSHGRPVARMVPVTDAGDKPFMVDFDWLRAMRVRRKQTPAEQIIREDRDARG